MHRAPTFIVLLALVATAARAQTPAAQPSAFALDVPTIMRGSELVGVAPEQLRWTDDGRWVFFRWNPGGRPWHERPALYRAPTAGGAPERLDDAAADSLGALVAQGERSPDGRWRVVAFNGDLFLIERRTLATRRLTRTPAPESSPVFGQGVVYFVRENNVFSLDLADGGLRQLTDIRPGPAPAEPKRPEGQRQTLEEEEKRLLEHVRREAERKAEEERRRKEREARRTRTVYLDRDERAFGLAVAPAGRYAVLQVGKPDLGARKVLIPDYITTSGYTETMEVRSKVGDAQAEGRVGLVTLATGEVRWLDLAPGAADQVPAADTAREKRETPQQQAARGKLAAATFLGWNTDGSQGLLGAVSYDYKDQWLHVLDAASGRLTRIAHDHDDAWIGGPCPDWSSRECAGWLPDGASVWFLSERDGFSHLYAAPAAGGSARQLTRGEWEVLAATLSPDRDRFYLHTSEGSPFEVHFYHMDLAGRARTRITTEPGRQDAVPSPDGRRLALIHSYATRPPEVYLAENRPGAPMRQVTTSPTDAWRSQRWIDPEIVWVEARDGVKVPARVYRPADAGTRANGAGVIFVHGAGYLHNVHKWWSTYYREYMFHNLLASRGYTVLDIDYRGSAGYGRDWRTAVYRHMGGKDLSDHVDGTRYLAQKEGVDARRIGIYGGSYGGFITLMALFTQPESFAAGAALRSVTDWAHYNHWYTRRILNLPQEDTVAYRRSSPIYFAEGLQDPLLIAHGMVDVNVHFQDVVRLAQRLIELGKKDWELAVYPVEDHGFVEPASWTDEYRRILELFDRHLLSSPVTSRTSGNPSEKD